MHSFRNSLNARVLFLSIDDVVYNNIKYFSRMNKMCHELHANYPVESSGFLKLSEIREHVGLNHHGYIKMKHFIENDNKTAYAWDGSQ